MKSISLTIPYELVALDAAVDMLMAMHTGLKDDDIGIPPKERAELPCSADVVVEEIALTTPVIIPTATVAPEPAPVVTAFTPAANIHDPKVRGHDKRIDSKGATLLADGNWRAKKGVDKVLRNSIAAEIIAGTSVPDNGVPPMALPTAPPAPLPTAAVSMFPGADVVPSTTVAPVSPVEITQVFKDIIKYTRGPDGAKCTDETTRIMQAYGFKGGVEDVPQLVNDERQQEIYQELMKAYGTFGINTPK